MLDVNRKVTQLKKVYKIPVHFKENKSGGSFSSVTLLYI